MNNIEALRKNYGQLTAAERTALLTNGLAERRPHVIQALSPANAGEARDAIWYRLGLVTVAALAAVQSLQDERRELIVGALPMALHGGTQEQLANAILQTVEARAAWRHALQQLEKETGMPFSKAACQFGGQDYLERNLGNEEGKPVDFRAQLELLRETWRAFCGERSDELES